MRMMLTLAAGVILAASQAQAQTLATVSGVAVDQATGAPLAGASVAVSDAADRPLTGAIADAAGRFTIVGLAPGQYRLRLDAVDYQAGAASVLVSPRNPIYDLGHLRLSKIDAAVEAVVVTAQTSVRADVGTNVFNMDQNIARSGGSVLDAMRALPGVTISEEGQVMLRGSDRVPVLIDGKPSALTGFGNQSALDSIAAGRVARIEIINNPSARYDAAGMAGIINIVYRQDRKLGFHGDIGLAAGVGALQRRKADIPSALGSYDFNPRYAPTVNLTYNTERASYFLQSEYVWRRDLPNNEFTTRFYDDGRVRYSQIPENRKQTRVVIKGGVDWRPTDRDTFSLSSIYDREHHNDYANIPYLDERRRTTRLWFWMEDEVTGFFNVNATYKRQFAAPGRQLSLNLQYTRGWEDEAYYLNEVSAVRSGTDTTHLIAAEHTLPVSIDYVHPLASGRFEAGAKLQLRRIPVTYNVINGFRSIIYPGLGDRSKWSETIYAGYANLVRETERLAVEGGLRAEQTQVRYRLDPANIYYPRSDAYSYFRIFANARLTYKLSDNTRASLFYNNRVDRPGEPELRVFPKYDDPELLKVGNPYLRPQFTQTYEARLEHNWNGATLSASLFRRSITDPFSRIYAIDPTATVYEVVNKIFHNTGRTTNTGLELLAAKRITPDWNVSVSFNGYRSSIDAYDAEVLFPVRRIVPLTASKETTWDAKLSSQLKLPWNVQLQATGIYYAARNIAQGVQSARGSLDLGVSKKLLDSRAELALTATDIFNTFGVEQTIQGVGFRAVYQNFNQTQAVTASLKYSF